MRRGTARRRSGALLTVLILLVAAPACTRADDDAADQTVATGPPGAPPEAGDGGPPPAWLSSGDVKAWLAFSSYCWEGVCADYARPTERDDLPFVYVTPGEKVEFHLGFDADQARLAIAAGEQPMPLEGSGRLWVWTADRTAVFVLHTDAGQGRQADYAVTISTADPPSPERPATQPSEPVGTPAS